MHLKGVRTGRLKKSKILSKTAKDIRFKENLKNPNQDTKMREPFSTWN